MGSTTLRLMLPWCPECVRVGAWVKPFAAFKRNVRIAYTWEPVLFKPGDAVQFYAIDPGEYARLESTC